MTKQITITLPAPTFLKSDASGKPVNINWDKLSESVIVDCLVHGAKIVMTNTYNSPGAKGSEAEKLAAMQKRLDAWYAGTYMIGSAGPRDSIMGDAKKQFLKKNPNGDAVIKAKVAATFGKDEKATFVNYLRAIATDLSKAKGTEFDAEFEALVVKAQEAANAHRKEEAEALANLDISVDDLF